MGRIWLYPISPGRGYYFAAGHKRWTDTSPESFAEMIRYPHGTDDRWTIRANRLRVQPGDRIVVYSAKRGKRPPILIGVGKITSQATWYRPWRSHTIRIQWDRKRTLQLSIAPIDATYLMERLPAQKGAVVKLAPDLQRWVSKKLDLRSKQLEEPPRAVQQQARSVKVVTIDKQKYEAVLRHDPRVLAPFQTRLHEQGWKVIRSISDGLATDLIATSSKFPKALIVEAKTNALGKGRAEIRYALGQLLDYVYFVRPRVPSLRGISPFRLVLLEKRPKSELIPFVESLGFGIAWNDRGRIFGGERTKQTLRTLLD